MKEQVLVCPVCGGALLRTERQYTCPAGHSFDVAKEGYVNLLCTSKSADKMGAVKRAPLLVMPFWSVGTTAA